MTAKRIAWVAMVAACLIAAVFVFIAGYDGYGVAILAVAAAAAINVF